MRKTKEDKDRLITRVAWACACVSVSNRSSQSPKSYNKNKNIKSTVLLV